MSVFPVSPLSFDCLTRDYYGAFDASIIAQLAPLSQNDCYQPKFYRAPAMSAEVLPALGYVSYGIKITPGSIIYALYLPCDGLTNLPGAFNVQIRDESLKMDWFDQPVPSYFLANCKPTYLSADQNVIGSAPYFLDSPYPVVGSGLLLTEFWETSGAPQRIELVFGVLDPVGGCL